MTAADPQPDRTEPGTSCKRRTGTQINHDPTEEQMTPQIGDRVETVTAKWGPLTREPRPEEDPEEGIQ